MLGDARHSLESISDSPQLDCQLLLCLVLGKSREWLYAHNDDILSFDEENCFRQLLERRLAGEPVAYITGIKPFWDRDFHVDPSVLVPRPETESLVETLLDRLDASPREVVDLGTGSGAIAVCLAAERGAWQVLGIDREESAINIARGNGEGLTNLTFRTGNWCEGIGAGSVDAIISNPPYIRAGDPHLGALGFEPASALVSGADGLDDIRQLVPESFHCLKTDGLLMIEHGYDQQQEVVEIFQAAGFDGIERSADLNGTPRSVLGYKS